MVVADTIQSLVGGTTPAYGVTCWPVIGLPIPPSVAHPCWEIPTPAVVRSAPVHNLTSDRLAVKRFGRLIVILIKLAFRVLALAEQGENELRHQAAYMYNSAFLMVHA